jgi:hypothetical protein
MAERRKVRSGTGGRTSTRSRASSDRDEQELLEEAPEQDEFRDADEPEDADDELLEADEPEDPDDELLEADEPEDPDDELLEADEETPEADEPEDADEDRSRGNGRRRPGRGGGSAMNASEAAKAALRQIAQLTAKQPEGITQVARTEDGWAVSIELIEDQRIPSSSDILATYETTIDADGELLSYRRVRRYARGRGDTEGL